MKQGVWIIGLDHRSGSWGLDRSGSQVWIGGLDRLWVLGVDPDLEFWGAAKWFVEYRVTQRLGPFLQNQEAESVASTMPAPTFNTISLELMVVNCITIPRQLISNVSNLMGIGSQLSVKDIGKNFCRHVRANAKTACRNLCECVRISQR